jgi:hypothetical protein
MQRLEAKNRPERPQGPPETERVERYRRKSPQKRPIGSRRPDLRFRRTGWWCAQSYANRSRLDIRLRTGNFLQNSANNRLPAGFRRQLAGYSPAILDGYGSEQALSSCCAKQALEAQYWAQETRHQAFVTFELVTVVRITDKKISKIETPLSLVRFAVFLNQRFALNSLCSEPASL